METPHYRTRILALLSDSPLTRADVIKNIKEFLQVGEFALAFDTLCEWIYEDDLEISPAYYAKIQELAEEMDAVQIVADLREQVDDSLI